MQVVYVTVLLPYAFLLALLIRGTTLPGAGAGILYYLKPDFYKLLVLKVPKLKQIICTNAATKFFVMLWCNTRN